MIPGLGTKIPHATRPGKKKKRERERDMKKKLEPSQKPGSILTDPAKPRLHQPNHRLPTDL